MLQIVNISTARKNLATLVEQVRETNKPVIILQDSNPSVVMYPFEESLKREEEKERLFQQRFEEISREGKKAFGKYLEKNNITPPKTEEEAYKIIKNA